MSRRLDLLIVAAASALACAQHQDQDQDQDQDQARTPREHKHRHYEREEAGGAPKFHDQQLQRLSTVAVGPQADATRPVTLALDVSADAIHIDDGVHWTSYPRRGGGQPIVQPSRGRLIPVVGDDSLMVWEHDGTTAGQRQIVAARSDDIDHSWNVLDYATEQAVAPPLVVAGRVAVVTTNAILHAPLDPSTNADGPGRLELALTPKTPPRSDGRRLVWAAVDGEHEVVLASAGRLTQIQTIWTQPTETGEIIDAAPVGSTVVFIHVDRWDGVEKTPLLRVRQDGTIIEVLPGMLREPDEQLITDGDRTWQFAKHKMFWWIGEQSHAFSRVVEDDVIAVAADDGVLVWQQADGLHVAGQATIEFPSNESEQP
jgi:hypothetical protein